jgi:hypothetical protein
MCWAHLHTGWNKNTKENLRKPNIVQSTSREVKRLEDRHCNWELQENVRNSKRERFS